MRVTPSRNVDTYAEVWGGITGGALYAELRKLDGEGLIEALREEQVGRRPARTVYQITAEGRLELIIQRDAALEVVFGSADPVSVVLLFAAGADPSELRERLAARRRRVAGQRETMTAERERLTGRESCHRWPWPRSAGRCALSCSRREPGDRLQPRPGPRAPGRPGRRRLRGVEPRQPVRGVRRAS